MEREPDRERVQVRNLLWDPEHHDIATLTLSIDPHLQTHHHFETLSLRDVLHNEPTTRSGRSGGQQLDYLLNHELEDSASSSWNATSSAVAHSAFNDLVLPPIQEVLKDPVLSAFKSGAPITDVLNAISPSTGTNAKDTELQLEALNRLTRARAAALESNDVSDSGNKRRKMDRGSARTLPRPTRKNGKKPQPPALLPPLLAPLHNPPVDARIVPSMNANRIHEASEMKRPLTFHCQATDSRTSTRAYELHMQAESKISDTRLEEYVLEQDGFPLFSQQSAQAITDKATEDSEPHAISKPDIKSRRRQNSTRLKWTADETKHLVDGVQRFGIGNWKNILYCKDYTFQEGRKGTDLKDRFRTCFPDQYRENGSQRGKPDSVVEASGKRRGRGGRTAIQLEDLGVKKHQLFPNQGRRHRNNFTQAEDDDLLKGYLKHKSRWKKIQTDPELCLQHRTRTDLRDRFRNRFPQRFKEAGSGLIAKTSEEDPSLSIEPEKSSQQTDERVHVENVSAGDVRSYNAVEDPRMSYEISSMAANGPFLNSMSSANQEEPSHSLRLLTSNFQEWQDFDFLDEDDHVSIEDVHLNRTIIDWADQNKLNNSAGYGTYAVHTTISPAALRDNSFITSRIDPRLLGHGNSNTGLSGTETLLRCRNDKEDRVTVSSTHQYSIDPLDASQRLSKPDNIATGHAGISSASVPLSKILNDR